MLISLAALLKLSRGNLGDAVMRDGVKQPKSN